MKDDADIRFVNTHSESIGGYHYADFPVLPAFLAEVFHCIIQSGMIEVSGNIFVHQQFGDFLCPSPVADINDGATWYFP